MFSFLHVHLKSLSDKLFISSIVDEKSLIQSSLFICKPRVRIIFQNTLVKNYYMWAKWKQLFAFIDEDSWSCMHKLERSAIIYPWTTICCFVYVKPCTIYAAWIQREIFFAKLIEISNTAINIRHLMEILKSTPNLFPDHAYLDFIYSLL